VSAGVGGSLLCRSASSSLRTTSVAVTFFDDTEEAGSSVKPTTRLLAAACLPELRVGNAPTQSGPSLFHRISVIDRKIGRR